jgi:hypothetical protein
MGSSWIPAGYRTWVRLEYKPRWGLPGRVPQRPAVPAYIVGHDAGDEVILADWMVRTSAAGRAWNRSVHPDQVIDYGPPAAPAQWEAEAREPASGSPIPLTR